MTKNNQSAKAMAGLVQTFYLTDPAGATVPAIRISVEWSDSISERMQDVLEESYNRSVQRISETL